jgi:hypothetical protein
VLAELSQIDGIEFVLAVGSNQGQTYDFWGLENPQPVAAFTQETLARFQALGERLQAGPLQQIVGTGPQRRVMLAACGPSQVCVGFPPDRPVEELRETMKGVLTKWAS